MSRAYVHGLACGRTQLRGISGRRFCRKAMTGNTSELCPQATHSLLRVIDDSHMTTLSREIKMADCRAALRIILLVGCFCLSSAIFSSNDNQERKVRHSKYELKLTEGFFFFGELYPN